jgi:glycyl-tRNA synthetase beta chain
VRGVPSETDALVEEFRGPSTKIGRDENGQPTKAAIGFARGKGKTAEELEIREVDGVEYYFAVVETPARQTSELLPEILLGLIEGISWPKSMRWGTTREVFTRPVRWLVALLGETVLPLNFAGVESSNTTRGHRFLAPGPHVVPNADSLVDVLRSAFVIPSQAEREARIRQGVSAAEAQTGYVATLPEKTLTEVINLSEYPTVMVGTFSEEFLAVPEEIIVDAMLMHQRYFPLYSNGKLTNKFIIVSNGNPDCESTIVDGNERVVAARLYDAKFFYDEDLKRPLEAYVEHLDEVVFQETLGTMKDKTNRVVELSCAIAADAGLSAQDAQDAKRAALLAKADLVTNAVIEFTSVQGVMGSYYAAAAGETEQVARAISEHYCPRFSGDKTPEQMVGKVVAIADKLDTICGLFAVNQAPTGSSDPFALRRAALGIIAILQDGVDISLENSIKVSLDTLKKSGIEFDTQAVFDQVVEFFVTRTKVMLRDSGVDADAVEAVLAAGQVEPMIIAKRARALQHARENAPETFDDLATAYARANNLRAADAGTNFDASVFTEQETALASAIEKASQTVESALQAGQYEQALESLAALRAPVDTFFETTMIMDENLDIRQNRMKLLNSFVAVFANVADFGALAKTK